MSNPILNVIEFQDLLMFYDRFGFDITTLDVDDKAVSAHLIIARIITEKSHYTPYEFLEEIVDGSLKEFLDTSIYEFDKFAQALEIIKGLKSGVDITQYWDATLNNSDFMMALRIGLEEKI